MHWQFQWGIFQNLAKIQNLITEITRTEDTLGVNKVKNSIKLHSAMTSKRIEEKRAIFGMLPDDITSAMLWCKLAERRSLLNGAF